MEDRTTSELILTLGNDVTKCHEELVNVIDNGVKDSDGNIEADYEYNARQFVRSVFAFIEGVTFSAKVSAVKRCLENNKEITDPERFFATDISYVLTDKGQVVEKKAHIKLSDNVRFAFALQEKSLGITDPFDANCKWWDYFKTAIRIRDRLTHPKLPKDIDISGEEIVIVLEAYNGFTDQLLKYIKFEKE